MSKKDVLDSFKGVYIGVDKEYLDENYSTVSDMLYKENGDNELYTELTEGEAEFPMLVGLDEDGKPIVTDLERETSGVIIGGAGSGKSWLLSSMLTSIVTTKEEKDVDIRLVDVKQSRMLSEFTSNPHVTTYCTDVEYVGEVLKDVQEEIEKRKHRLVAEGEESFRAYRKRLKKEGNDKALNEIPMVVLVIDEFTSTLGRLREVYRDDQEKINELIGLLEEVTKTGRAVGVKLLVFGQRANETNLPKQVLYNSSLKVFLGKNPGTDCERVFGQDGKELPEVDNAGEGYVSTVNDYGVKRFSDIPIGTGYDDSLELISSIAEEWTSRTEDE